MVSMEITYCQPCGHQPKAMELVNELLATYGMPLNRNLSVTLKPADKGVFDIVLDGKLVFSRKEVGRFPTFDEVKKEMDPKLTVQLGAPTL